MAFKFLTAKYYPELEAFVTIIDGDKYIIEAKGQNVESLAQPKKAKKNQVSAKADELKKANGKKRSKNLTKEEKAQLINLISLGKSYEEVHKIMKNVSRSTYNSYKYRKSSKEKVTKDKKKVVKPVKKVNPKSKKAQAKIVEESVAVKAE